MQHLAFSSSIDIEYSEELSISDVKTNVWYYGIKCNNIFSISLLCWRTESAPYSGPEEF